ncbi:phosphoribosylformylglycinamidine synthase subunit PurQ [Ponticaulis sp.]|uniref:phosphoribosylformylglycinamidine synthase subunit PurQ n=1 Tax=Ponticaulis sp. TaxID=2020902 RepID=UPI000B736270|nr:phosphoribosylformylglycinamidine synthase subunit PurQ [Ponticaulis sp.]MAI89736.1 phosphoribosylformylglycinamidine synthase I [Ponticaulis sp.]OUY00751.1 MAG: phosphoribosylformylglycinamidine synthase I [Hyphomonadaceae bacterium TMED5]|tara:strand:- start:47034 stop:47705 length:672 start_codon:yes stop_codon:yes gene_type:complete
MKSGVIIFPGSNCDRDAITALKDITGQAPAEIWHKTTEWPTGLDFVVVPGGFSYGDYLRCGAMAGNSPIIPHLKKFAEAGGHVLGICNGFQILTETGLLPGALLRNAALNFVCRNERLIVSPNSSAFTSQYKTGSEVIVPVAHHDGNYFADADTLDLLEGDGRVAFRYADNPNGSARDIAGILSTNGRVLGMMPHPERAIGGHEGGSDGRALFEGVMNALATV